MTHVDTFLGDPAKKSHRSYEDSLLSFAAPEYATGEVLLGSAYRKLILDEPEGRVDLEHINGLASRVNVVAPVNGLGDRGLWDDLVSDHGALASPMRGKQVKFPQLMPLVPRVALYACVLGSQRSRWNPGNLLLQVIGAGRGEDGVTLVRDLGRALEVGAGGDEDIFARFVERGLKTVGGAPPSPRVPHFESIDPDPRAFRGASGAPAPSRLSPAERFCGDLEAVLGLKGALTRRQWTVLVESILRLGLGMHVLWVCHVNYCVWQYVLRATREGVSGLPGVDAIEKDLWGGHGDTSSLLEVGRNADPLLGQLVDRYVEARLGLNLLLWRLEDAGHPWQGGLGYVPRSSRSTAHQVGGFLAHVAHYSGCLATMDTSGGAFGWLRDGCVNLLDARYRFPKNMREFARYNLGQAETAEPGQQSYDQSYLLTNNTSKHTNRAALDLPVQPGPVMLTLLVHACCRAQGAAPASLDDFRSHLADYGLHAPAGALVKGPVGTDLEKLGLVVDSPDAAGGRLLVDPFARHVETSAPRPVSPER